MATYITITPADLANRFGPDEVAKWTEFGADVAQVIDDAAGEAQGYLAARYDLTKLTSTPPEVIGALADLVRYRVYGDMASERVAKRAEEAKAYLRDLGAGRAALVIQDDPTTPENESGQETASYTAGARLFSRSGFAGW